MRILIDSHALIWGAFAPSLLSKRGLATLTSDAHQFFVSPISINELEVKKAAGRMGFPDVGDWSAFVAAQAYEVLPLALSHAVAAAKLPPHHRDPWDRMIIAQAIAENLAIMTADDKFAQYGVPTIW